MTIQCSKCENKKRFILPVWVRATFRFNEDGTISILHTRPLEAIEEKLVNNELVKALKCAICKSPASITFDNEQSKRQQQALEAL